MNQFLAQTETQSHQLASPGVRSKVSTLGRIPTPPALIALYVLCALPGLVGAVLALVSLMNDRDVMMLLTSMYLVLATLGLYLLLVLPLVAIIQAIHQTIRFGHDRRG